MLSWDSGPKACEGCSAPAWYKRPHESTGFGTTSPPSYETLSPRLKLLFRSCVPFYEALKNRAHSPDAAETLYEDPRKNKRT